jgi:hypothetical protein
VTASAIARSRAAAIALAVSATTLLGAARPAGAQAPRDTIRFPIVQVGDSTFELALGRHTWVRPRAVGIVIDPRRRDSLVARFEVLGVTATNATALVTGQTTRIMPDQIALLERPRRGALMTRMFWNGVGVGAVVGGAVAALITSLTR